MTSVHRQAELLIFVEDPGAANMVADLPGLLRRRGCKVRLVTSGSATAYLQQRGIAVEPLPQQSNLERFVADLAPRLIVVGTAENPDSPGLQLTAIAAAMRIPCVGVLDSSTHLGFRFRGRSADPLQFCPDRVIVPDTVSRDGLVALGLSPDRIVVAGHPHWDHVRSVRDALGPDDRAELRRRHFQLSSPRRLAILFAAEISGGMDPGQFQKSTDYTLSGSGSKTGRTEIVIEEFLSAVAPRRREFHLVLRLHPKQEQGDLSEYHWRFDTVSRTESSLEAVFAADRVVGMTSMLMIEAALMQRPALSILPRALEAAWLTTLAAGVTPYACTRAAVGAGIARLLDDPQPATSAALDRLFPPGALDRIVATVELALRS